MLTLKRHNLFVIVFLCSLIYAKSRSISVSQTGDVRIELTDDKWLCDKIECPSATERCYVSKKNDLKDPSILVRTNICYSKDNESLAQSVTTSKIDPNHKIQVEINSHRSGSISTVNNYNGDNNYNGNFNFNGDFDEETFNADLQKDLDELHTNIENQVANINKEVNDNLEKLSYNLAHMFD